MIVINFCRCPTLAYMAAMYTGMFCHFSFKVFAQETLCISVNDVLTMEMIRTTVS